MSGLWCWQVGPPQSVNNNLAAGAAGHCCQELLQVPHHPHEHDDRIVIIMKLKTTEKGNIGIEIRKNMYIYTGTDTNAGIENNLF